MSFLLVSKIPSSFSIAIFWSGFDITFFLTFQISFVAVEDFEVIFSILLCILFLFSLLSSSPISFNTKVNLLFSSTSITSLQIPLFFTLFSSFFMIFLYFILFFITLLYALFFFVALVKNLYIRFLISLLHLLYFLFTSPPQFHFSFIEFLSVCFLKHSKFSSDILHCFSLVVTFSCWLKSSTIMGLWSDGVSTVFPFTLWNLEII